MSKKYLSSLIFCAAFFTDCARMWAQSQLTFVENAKNAGLTAQHFDGGGSQEYLPQLMTTGLATFDFDGDVWTDIYLLNGCALPLETPR